MSQTKDVKMVPSGRNAEKLVTVERLQGDIEYLTDTVFGGRATGSRGANEAAFWIANSFRNAGLMPFSGRYSQSFRTEDAVGHNIIGFMPGTRSAKNETYVIVTAHYDSFGKLSGRILPGANSNASGVVTMLNVMDMLKFMKDLGRVYGSSIIFLATDAREKNAAGAQAFVTALNAGEFKDPVSQKTIEARQIKNTVVLDILGATTEPLHKGGRKDYLIMLGAAGDRYDLQSANNNPGLSLELGFDYYGSQNFTDMIRYRTGDQKVFASNGMPCTIFTSGITFKINNVEDNAESLNYEVLRKRVILIFHWLTKIL